MGASMGPRPCGRGRLKGWDGKKAVVIVLQWGHGLAAVDGAIRARRAFRASRWLQWGHGLAAVDGDETDDEDEPEGELQWGHGLAAVDGSYVCGHSAPGSGFNGATALRPWTAVSGIGAPPNNSSFNGATALRPWTGRRLPRRATSPRASMGPRPCGRGRRAAARQPPCQDGCFNGATALRPWTGGQPVRSAGMRTSFNGATALRPWTVRGKPQPIIPDSTLQWGHGLAAVDGIGNAFLMCADITLQWGHGLAAVDGRARRIRRRRRSASMGPRPCGRGRSSARSEPQRYFPSFNGATALRPWTEDGQRSLYVLDLGFNGATALRPWTAGIWPLTRSFPSASMGPRPCGRCGRFNGATALRPWTARLGQTDVQFWVDRRRMHCQHRLFASYSFRPAAFVMPAL